ncbi:MAG: hypothetical protein ACEQSR_01635 [Candidatus Methylacidiphilales bacterium]
MPESRNLQFKSNKKMAAYQFKVSVFIDLLLWHKSLNRELSLALKSEKAKGNY